MSVHVLSEDGIPVDLSVIAEASELDKKWFNARPKRKHRLRKCLPGEFGDTRATHVLVIKVGPGERVRYAFAATQDIMVHDEITVKKIADRMLAGQPIFIEEDGTLREIIKETEH